MNTRLEAWLIRKLRPSLCVDAVTDLDPAALWRDGLRGAAIDFDNTLVAWDAREPTAEVRAWLERMRDQGFRLIILSNAGRTSRVRPLAEEVGIAHLGRAGKPFWIAYRRALRQLELPAEQVAMIGDQLMTDVLGGNRAGLFTVLVRPIRNRDFVLTRFNRALERRALAWLRKRTALPRD